MVDLRNIKPSNKALWNCIAGLILCAFLATIGVWKASHLFGQDLAQKQASEQAATLHRQVILSLERGLSAFTNEKTEYVDQKFFQRLVRASDVYRVSLINKGGRTFWSTNTRSSADQLPSGLHNQLVNDSSAILESQIKKAAEIDQMMRRMPFGEYNPQQNRNVIVVLTPVLQDGKFVGAVELSMDATNTISLFAGKMNTAAISIGGFLAALFLLVGFVFYRHVQRENSLLASVADEARKAEAEARDMADQLTVVNEEVGQLNRSLKVNYKQLSDAQDELLRKGRLAQMGELTATIAHEIRNPLGSVRTSAFLVKRKLEKLGIDLAGPLDRINHGVERCDNIISELLDFTRIGQIDRQTLNLNDWILDTVREQAEKLPDVVGIECSLSGQELEANFDPDRMQRVLINMLSNASEAMVGKKGDPEDVVVEKPQIAISSIKTLRGIEFKVSDNGPGMTEEQLGKIFEPLYSTKNFGVGLGVPAIQKILEQHGGGLDYQSEPGKGTVATAWFPLEFAQAAPVSQVDVPEKFKVVEQAN